jgi:DNA-binding YbaB/EbfC family protein
MKNLGELMKQAQQMQERMGKFQEELAALEIEGSSGAGLVKVTLSGKGELKHVKLDPSILQPDDAEMVEDLIVAAHADAKTKLEAKMQEEQQNLLGGMPMPPGFKLPL